MIAPCAPSIVGDLSPGQFQPAYSQSSRDGRGHSGGSRRTAPFREQKPTFAVRVEVPVSRRHGGSDGARYLPSPPCRTVGAVIAFRLPPSAGTSGTRRGGIATPVR